MRVLFIAAITALSCSGQSFAGNFPFQPTRYPFLPMLAFDEDPAVCHSFLETITAAFKGPLYDLSEGGWDWRGAQADWIFPVRGTPQPGVVGTSLPVGSEVPPPEHDDEESGTSVYSLTADVDGDGHEEVLAMSRSRFNWQYNGYALMLFSSQNAFEGALRSAKSDDDLLSNAINIEPGEVRAYTSAPYFALVRLGGKFYSLGFPSFSDNRYTLFRVDSKAPPSLTCSVVDIPTDDGWQRRLAGRAVAELVDIVRSVSGTEAYGSGTYRAQTLLLIEAADVVTRVVLRPWVLDQVEPYNSRAKVDAGVAGWGEASLYNHRQRRALKKSESVAVEALAHYYAEGYGLSVSDASKAAEKAIDILIRSYFVFPSDGIQPKPDTAYRTLTRALLQNAPRDRIIDLIKSGAKIRTGMNRGSDKEPGESAWSRFDEEPTLFFALESPGNLAVLLDAGVDPNVKGNFDKTALMYAAQFDLLESAKVLLAYGADLNAETGGGGSETAMELYPRTALIYAAQNASADLIRLLLSRGADPTAADKTGRGVLDYLDWNRKLSSEDRAAVTAELMGDGATPGDPRFGKPVRP